MPHNRNVQNHKVVGQQKMQHIKASSKFNPPQHPCSFPGCTRGPWVHLVAIFPLCEHLGANVSACWNVNDTSHSFGKSTLSGSRMNWYVSRAWGDFTEKQEFAKMIIFISKRWRSNRVTQEQACVANHTLMGCTMDWCSALMPHRKVVLGSNPL